MDARRLRLRPPVSRVAVCAAVGIVMLMAGCSYAPPKTAPAPDNQRSAPEYPPVTPAYRPAPAPAPVTPQPAQPDTRALTTTVPRPDSATTTPKAKPRPTPQITPPPAPAPIARQPARSAPAPTPAAPDTTPAPIQIAIAAPAKTAPDTITVSLDNMPMRIHDQWILDRNETRCTLQNTPQQMDDGQGGTRVTFLLAPDSLHINTQSDIDLSYSETGITIDNGLAFKLDTVERRTNLNLNTQRKALLNSMMQGQQLELRLGFWPTWPVTHTYSLTLPLQHFAPALNAWETCNQLLRRR